MAHIGCFCSNEHWTGKQAGMCLNDSYLWLAPYIHLLVALCVEQPARVSDTAVLSQHSPFEESTDCRRNLQRSQIKDLNSHAPHAPDLSSPDRAGKDLMFLDRKLAMSHTIPKGSQLALLAQAPGHAVTGRPDSSPASILVVRILHRIPHMQRRPASMVHVCRVADPTEDTNSVKPFQTSML